MIRTWCPVIWALAVIFSICGDRTLAQEPVDGDFQIKAACDSVVAEGNLLYRYEKAAWEATDIGLANEEVRKNLFNLLVYEQRDTIKVCLLDQTLHSICEVSFAGRDNGAQIVSFTSRPLSDRETEVFLLKNKLIDRVTSGGYGVGVPDSFGLNFVLLPAEQGYRFYILTGTSKSGIIPFGNDYLFFVDSAGKITDWRKMHTILLPLSNEVDGLKVKRTIHTHRPEEPYITATDICTFKLYGPLCGQESFTIVSALRKAFTYDLKTDSVLIQDVDSGRKNRKARKK